jgi:hypothetical protein
VIGITDATFTVADVLQPPGIVYTMVVLPGAIALRIPKVASIVATEGALLVQLPPATAFSSASVAPTQTVPAPVMAAGKADTVTTAVVTLPNNE